MGWPSAIAAASRSFWLVVDSADMAGGGRWELATELPLGPARGSQPGAKGWPARPRGAGSGTVETVVADLQHEVAANCSRLQILATAWAAVQGAPDAISRDV